VDAVTALKDRCGVPVRTACDALAVPRATYYRAIPRPSRTDGEPAGEAPAEAVPVDGISPDGNSPDGNSTDGSTPDPAPSPPRPRGGVQPNALDPATRQAVLDAAHEDRFADRSVDHVFFTLLDEGVYLCSRRSFYRILAERGETRERRAQATHPPTVKPQLIATGPNRVWSWDITKVKGPGRHEWFDLYVVIDVWSRKVVAWRLEERESSELAAEMLEQAYEREGVEPGRLTVHADRGTSMTSKTVAQLYSDLGIEPSHSRPRVSNDNPYSESHFKTMKYGPGYPRRFESIGDARNFMRGFFPRYNHEHRHSGIGYVTPASMHDGTAPAVVERRRLVLAAAYEANPGRFPHGPPTPPALPTTAWINPAPGDDVAVAELGSDRNGGDGEVEIKSEPTPGSRKPSHTTGSRRETPPVGTGRAPRSAPGHTPTGTSAAAVSGHSLPTPGGWDSELTR
jgi:putative transposase